MGLEALAGIPLHPTPSYPPLNMVYLVEGLPQPEPLDH